MDARCSDNTTTLNSKKVEKLREKVIRIIKFLANNPPVLKEMHISKIIKLRDFITVQNIFFINDCL